MKGRVIEPIKGIAYYYVDPLADDGVSTFEFSGSVLDYDLQDRHLIFHDYASAQTTAEKLIEYLKTITE